MAGPVDTRYRSPGPSRPLRRTGVGRRSAIGAFASVLVLAALACTPPPGGGGGGPQPPVAVADTTGSFGPAPFAVSFVSAGSHDPDGAIATYDWDFGDGTTSPALNPTKVYATPGTYEVTLTVTDLDGLSATSVPVTVTSHPPGDPSGLAFFPGLSRSVGLGEDRIAVWTCEVTGSGGPVHDPVAVAAWAQAEVDAYFPEASDGRYEAVFSPAGTFSVSDNGECLDEARDRTGAPYTNVLTVDTATDGGGPGGLAGLGGPGYVYSDGTGAAPDEPPSQSRRGFWVSGRTYTEFPESRTLVHELGHTLHWPHSFIDPAHEYDNPLDLMSARVGPFACSTPLGSTYQCAKQHTLAFNRWATGWIDSGDVVLHNSGTLAVELVRPGAPGAQLLAAPATNSSQALVTIEARPTVGFDSALGAGGVAVHVVDQRASVCDVADTFGGCPSLWRRQGQAWGNPSGYDHVLGVGESHTIHGLTVTVDSATADGYQVSVSGSANIPVTALATDEPESAAAHKSLSRRSGGGHRIDLPTIGG